MTGQTPLDAAFAAAAADPARQTDFYGLLLETELFFPIVETDPAGGDVIAAPDEGGSISPLLLDIEGSPVLPVFDDAERLVDWADGNKLAYASLPGHAIVEVAAGQTPVVQIAFNIGQASFRHLATEEIGWLCDAWKAMHEEVEVPPSASLEMAAPDADYSELKSALSSRMASLEQIERAYVIWVTGLSAERAHDICVVLDVNRPGVGGMLAEKLGPVVSRHGPPGESVIIAGGHPHMLEYARNEIEPFYERAAA